MTVAAAAPAADLVLSCSLCWSGSGDCTDPGTGAVVCFGCMAELDSRSHPVAPVSPLRSPAGE